MGVRIEEVCVCACVLGGLREGNPGRERMLRVCWKGEKKARGREGKGKCV